MRPPKWRLRWRYVYFALWCTRMCNAAFTASTLTLFPVAKTCEALQITLAITSDAVINAGETVTLKLPFVTSGDCNNAQGSGIASLVMDATSETLATATWTEGTVATMFSGSLITFTVKSGQTLAATTAYTFHIDASNGLKLIGKPLASPTMTLSTNAASGTVSDAAIATISTISATGFFVKDDKLWFRNAVPKTPTAILFAFEPSFNLASGDTIRIEIPGITSGAAAGVAGSSIGSLSVVVTPTASTMACAYTEGTAPSTPFLRGFDGSVVICTMSASHTAGVDLTIEISVTTSQQLKAHCGLPGNSGHEHHGTRVTIVQSGGSTTLLADKAIHTVQAVGQTCQERNFCNGHGYCDMCQGTCNCHRGYGNTTEDGSYIISDDPTFSNFKGDCSERVCPGGLAFGAVPTSNSAAHVLKECSGNGDCDRGRGRCRCYENFHGQACEFLICPIGSNGEVCSGHGQCKKIRQLAQDSSAVPLGSSTTDSYTSGSTSSWDFKSTYGCVCDTSSEWLALQSASAVGLGSGQVQEVEWYGPDCSLKHCPSGDDPGTTADETDCNGVKYSGLSHDTTNLGAGASGNKCHVECSNRGICDPITGTCTCFPGYRGVNCGTTDVLAT